jgi:mRNA interferase MazF
MKCKEIWMLDLRPTEGSEIEKIRPCIIVSDDQIGILPLRVIVPLTGFNPRFNASDWMVKFRPTEKTT